MVLQEEFGNQLADAAADELERMRALYLDVVKRGLTHTLYWPPDVLTLDEITDDENKKAALRAAFANARLDVKSARVEGRDWPRFAQTMVGLRRLTNVQECVEEILRRDVPGDFIEAGVWRGGVVIMMLAVLKSYGVTDRTVFAADSFRGLPEPNPEQYPADAEDTHFLSPQLAVSRAHVKRNIDLYGLLENVKFLEGWFSETLPSVRNRKWALIRLDGDMYESTMDSLVNLYPGLSPGGYIIIDDYAHPACRRAVDEYRAEHNIIDPVELIDWTGAYWRRSD